jgi:hypothetical protein
MRYLKGSIGLNVKADGGILRFIAESRYVTHSQLWQFVRALRLVSGRHVFNWRVRRLVRSVLVRRQVVPFLDGEALYSITGRGIQALERLGIYYLGAGLDREKDLHEFQIPHALELNSIRLTFMRTDLLWRWIPEPLIRVLSLSPATAYAKVYDGIAGILLNDKVLDIAVEYERTLKSQAKYAKVREAIVSERRVDLFLYLAPSSDLLYSLCREFWRMERLLFFGNVREFKEKALIATVYDTYGRSLSFQDMLLKAIAAESRI